MKREIAFWKKAKEKLKKDYRMQCKEHVDECIECQAKKTVEFIDNHIKLL